MNAKEFGAWLEGYLEDKKELTPENVAKIVAKSRAINNSYYEPYPWISNPWGTTTTFRYATSKDTNASDGIGKSQGS
jgi:hypothetical protein